MEQQNQNTQQPGAPKKSLGPGGWTVVVVLAAIIFYVAQKTGCGPVRTEEKMEWIDR